MPYYLCDSPNANRAEEADQPSLADVRVPAAIPRTSKSAANRTAATTTSSSPPTSASNSEKPATPHDTMKSTSALVTALLVSAATTALAAPQFASPPAPASDEPSTAPSPSQGGRISLPTSTTGDGAHVDLGANLPPQLKKAGYSKRGGILNVAHGNAANSTTPELVPVKNYQKDIERLPVVGDKPQ
ncbi:uncharacterized protein BXZ73DRAFT_103460 [Epithele typhae]|uniref:uncharacterized protein n=1 Tax=Epithele typhae TaxID=378194 RepID=UPI0020089C87|nr:uncharacterized protein BXZ73DRAFT_103460 [Epithele typhae]KAH9924620.1 hypothetical protein BXZ73DRAFT_103460 [Epithele typhae]